MTCETDRPLRICMAAGYFLPNIGGVERYVYNLSKALVQLGSKVAVATSHTAHTSLSEQLDQIDVFRLPSIELGGGRLPIPTPFSPTVRRQIDAIANWKPDIFVIHTHLFVSNLYIAQLAKKLRKPYVIINHGSGYVNDPRPIVNATLKVYERLLANRIGKHASGAFGVSRSAAKWLGEFGIQTANVIANGVDTTMLPARNPTFRSRMGVPKENCLIAFAARLLPEKGADTLLSVFQKLDPSNATLAIAGDGPALSSLRATAGGDHRVHFLGACSHTDVLSLFGSADIMAYPSRYPEGQPTTVLEAGAMGCAVVATPKGGTAELINSSDLGFIVNSSSELEEALQCLLDDPGLRQRLGAKLQEKVRTQHDWRVIAGRALEVFGSTCRDFERTNVS